MDRSQEDTLGKTCSPWVMALGTATAHFDTAGPDELDSPVVSSSAWGQESSAWWGRAWASRVAQELRAYAAGSRTHKGWMDEEQASRAQASRVALHVAVVGEYLFAGADH